MDMYVFIIIVKTQDTKKCNIKTLNEIKFIQYYINCVKIVYIGSIRYLPKV